METKSDSALKNFFENADSERLLLALEHSPKENLRKFGRALQRAEFSKMTPQTLSRELGAWLPDLLEAYKDVNVAIGSLRMFEQLPEVVAENTVDALPTSESCPRCDGLRRIPDETDTTGKKKRRCPKCLGTGKVRKPGLIEAKKLVYDHAGLLPKGGGAQVNQQFNIGMPSLSDSIDTREKVLEAKKPEVIDVEPE